MLSSGCIRVFATLVIVTCATIVGPATDATAASVERPGAAGGPTEIMASVIMLDLDTVNDANQSYEANVYVELMWTDPRLRDEPVAESNVWRPRVAIGNRQQAWAILPESLEIGGNGSLRLSQNVWGSFSQPLDLRRFPFDTQVLKVTLLADAASNEIVFVQHPDRPSGISKALSVPDWEILDVSSEGRLFEVSEGIDPIPSFVMTISAERRFEYYVFTMIVPLVVIVGMAFASFWIDPANFGTKIALASASMLTVVTYRVASVQILPRTSYFTDMDIFIVGCTVLVFLALVGAVVTSVKFREGKEVTARRVDQWARRLAPLAFIAVIASAFA